MPTTRADSGQGVTELRFDTGARVRCKVSAIEWARGTVVATHYREDHWPRGRTAPYQVELDDGHLIFAPFDSDDLIRDDASFEQLLYEEQRDREAASERYRDDVVTRYPRRHPALFEPTELARFLDPRLHAALQSKDDDALRGLWTDVAPGLHSLPFLTRECCAMLIEECEHFEDWCNESGVPLHRPNTMNNHGAILDDFGMSDMMQKLMVECVEPLARLAGFADVIGGESLIEHHAFLVAYALGKDRELSFHVDSSDVTLNVCLGRTFEGGDLYFRGVRCRQHQQTGALPEETVSYSHEPGVAILHRGHHRHGAHPIVSGERINLILWCRGDPTRSSEGANHQPGCQPWCWRHEEAQ